MLTPARTASLAVFAACLAVSVIALAADESERGLIAAAPAILKYAQEKGYHNIGVLKFRIKKGDRPGSDRAGTLNSNLAMRLELALIMANKVRTPIGIVHDASAVAAQIPGASHLSAEGRQKLFSAKYPLAWGSESVEPDAFFTGAVSISNDLKTMVVGIVAFDRTSTALEKVTQFSIVPDVDDLVETGESFVVRGLFDGGKVSKTGNAGSETQLAVAKVVESAVKVKDSTDPSEHPLAPSNGEAPVELELFYDQQKVPLEIHDGAAFVVEPQENQKVTFVLKRKAKDNVRYGVVLKVNGENTLGRQRLKDADCRKWILEPNAAPITVRGFQVDNQTAEEFHVLSRAESKAKEIDYGTDVGTINLVVFRERVRSNDAPAPPSGPAPADAPAAPKAAAPPNAPAPPSGSPPADAPAAPRSRPAAKPDVDEEDFAVLTRAVFPKQKPANLAALKAQLSQQASRGLIVQGQLIQAGTRTVSFITDPTPVMSAVITYYPR
jgi:hypothetical protein